MSKNRSCFTFCINITCFKGTSLNLFKYSTFWFRLTCLKTKNLKCWDIIYLGGYNNVFWIPGCSDGKESACNVGDLGLIPGPGRCPGEGNGYQLWYSCVENPMDKRSLAGYSPWGHKELRHDWLTLRISLYSVQQLLCLRRVCLHLPGRLCHLFMANSRLAVTVITAGAASPGWVLAATWVTGELEGNFRTMITSCWAWSVNINGLCRRRYCWVGKTRSKYTRRKDRRERGCRKRRGRPC